MRHARGAVMASRVDGGTADRQRQRETIERCKLMRALQAARRVAVEGRRVAGSIYEIESPAWLAMLHAVDEADELLGITFSRHPGDAEADGAAAGMQEVYG